MDPLTITTSTFTLMDGIQLVSGTVNYSNTTATFTPGSALISGKTYTATITAGAKNVQGITLANNMYGHFHRIRYCAHGDFYRPVKSGHKRGSE